ncbi:MAG: hypothetical protein H0T71_13260 [Acidobacteria bacterium]|nr:hypothetical protein [Acidobacteriota bacterium]
MSRLCVAVLSALVLSAMASARTSDAQTPPNASRQLAVLSLIDVKPELMSEFGALQAEVMTAQRVGGQPWRETWNTATFGYPYRVAVLSPVDGLGQLDGQTYTVKGVGAAAATALNARARPMIDRQQILLLQVRPDLEIGTRPAKGGLGVISYISVSTGREVDMERVLRTDVHAALRKAAVTYYGVSRVVYGGDTNQYVTLLMFENFTELDRGHPLERVLGADGFAALQGKQAGVIAKLERHVIRYNEALSFRQAAAKP